MSTVCIKNANFDKTNVILLFTLVYYLLTFLLLIPKKYETYDIDNMVNRFV